LNQQLDTAGKLSEVSLLCTACRMNTADRFSQFPKLNKLFLSGTSLHVEDKQMYRNQPSMKKAVVIDD
jgi:hypothetical protein